MTDYLAIFNKKNRNLYINYYNFDSAKINLKFNYNLCFLLKKQKIFKQTKISNESKYQSGMVV
jgi:hypothetical protein